jgi:hypothetical protein
MSFFLFPIIPPLLFLFFNIYLYSVIFVPFFQLIIHSFALPSYFGKNEDNEE